MELRFKGLWRDDRDRLIEITQRNQFCWIGYILWRPSQKENSYNRVTKVMYDWNGVNKMDQSKLMEHIRKGSTEFAAIKINI